MSEAQQYIVQRVAGSMVLNETEPCTPAEAEAGIREWYDKAINRTVMVCTHPQRQDVTAEFIETMSDKGDVSVYSPDDVPQPEGSTASVYPWLFVVTVYETTQGEFTIAAPDEAQADDLMDTIMADLRLADVGVVEVIEAHRSPGLHYIVMPEGGMVVGPTIDDLLASLKPETFTEGVTGAETTD